jgi:hypothetical protein
MLCYYISRYNREKIMRYEMTEHCITVSNTPVYQVRYLVDIPKHKVKKGDLGGYIRDEKVLPQDGTGIVLGDAMVIGGTVVGGTVLGDAMVAGGTIRGGVIRHGSIYGGTIRGGSIHGGTIYGGVVYGGAIRGGEIHGGTIYDGVVKGGKIYGGEIHNGEIHGGEIHGGVVYGSIWHCAPLTIYPGKYPMCVCDYNTLKIGCMRYSINYWLTNAANVGKKKKMSDTEIELYVRMIHTVEYWHDHVTSRRLLLPQNPH